MTKMLHNIQIVTRCRSLAGLARFQATFAPVLLEKTPFCSVRQSHSDHTRGFVRLNCSRSLIFETSTNHRTMDSKSKPKAINGQTQYSTAVQEPTDLHDPRSNRLIWVDLEMTGLDFVNDRILEIACLITEGDLSIVAEGPNLIIHESEDVLNSMDEWCIKHHGESGLTEAVKNSKVSLQEAETIVLDFVREHTPPGKCPLAGNTIGMDKSFIERHMPQLAKQLHHRVIDVSSVKELCRRWYSDDLKCAPVKKDKHRAMDDILESLEELKFYRSKIFK